MEPCITIVGTGPGHPRYLTPAAGEAIAGAQVVMGGKRLLEAFSAPGQERFVIDKNLQDAVEYIRSQPAERRIAVLVSGDTGFYSLAAYLRKQMTDTKMEFIPGISSVQYMFAQLQQPWQNAAMVSMHGRTTANLHVLVETSPVSALLTGGEWTPQTIARHLKQKGIDRARVAIGKNLSYPDEIIILTTLAELLENPADFSNSVMVIYHEK